MEYGERGSQQKAGDDSYKNNKIACQTAKHYFHIFSHNLYKQDEPLLGLC